MSRVNAVRIHKNGGPEELRYEEVEVGEPGPGEARVRHTAIGLNFTDIHHRTGRYPVAEFPHVIPPFDLFRLNRMGSLYVTSAGLADYLHTRDELLERAADLFSTLKSGAVRVSVKQRYPLADAARAHRDLETRRTVGSSILVP